MYKTRAGRRVLDLDYKVLHSTGAQVKKNRGENTKMEDLKTQSIKICSDIEDFRDSYNLEDITEDYELQQYVNELKSLKQEYRRIHKLLKSQDGENFAKEYPNFEEEIETLNTEFKTATKKLSDTKKVKEKEVIDPIFERERLQVEAERKLFAEQVKSEIDRCDFDKISQFEQIKMHIDHFQVRLDKFLKLCSQLSSYGVQGLDHENEALITSLKGMLDQGSNKMYSLNAEIKLREAERVAAVEAQEKLRQDNLVACAKGLKHELDIRYDTLLGKLEIDLDKLNDFEILDLKKQEPSLHVELREFIDKVSEFNKFVLECGDTTASLSKDASAKCDACNSAMSHYLDRVSEIITEKDISEKKLSSSASLNLDFEKFSGYDAPMDIYTFKSDFEKLLQPDIRKGMLGDYLKKNCLTGAALNLVSKIEEVDKIWEKLIEVYGNSSLLLQRKLLSLGKFSNLEKIKDDEKMVHSLTKLINTINELRKLAADFSLENDLYYGVGLQKILELLGEKKRRKFVRSIAQETINGEAKWVKLVKFLESDLKEWEALVLDAKISKSIGKEAQGKEDHLKKDDDKKKKVKPDKSDSSFTSNHQDPKAGKPSCDAGKPSCVLCGDTKDHVLSYGKDGVPYIEYIACKVFVEKTPQERDKLLFKKKLCNKCLTPGVKFSSTHDCDTKFICPNKHINRQGIEVPCKKHVLVCGFHCKEKRNTDMLELYKKSVLKTNSGFSDFSKNVSLFSESYTSGVSSPDEADSDPDSIFAFQPYKILHHLMNLFYDSGCGDMVASKRAIDILVAIGWAELEKPGPLILEGVNNQVSVCKYGRYSIKIPLADGTDAVMSGLCFDDVTSPFPTYNLTKVEEDFRARVKAVDKHLFDRLPKLPKEVGGPVDIMIGKHYLKYFPREITRLESGLTLYESMFLSLDGTRGIISGPHPEFTKIHRSSRFSDSIKRSYYSSDVKNYIEYLQAVTTIPCAGTKIYKNFGILECPIYAV